LKAKKFLVVGVVLCALGASAALEAQARGAQGRAERAAPQLEGAPGVSPGEIQQMFDAYVLVQAQDVLQLADDRYPQFVTRLRALQTVRRRGENQRMMLINQLRRILQAADGRLDESMIKDRLRMLSELDATVAAEVKQAQESLDEVLDVRQQARFRVFEQEMERRKVELVMRARPANRTPGRN
jgi:hypothetical protein